ncbi:hypothetical protein [Nocardioides ochotonae]|uniref:hypothetical protein n=1 Tax=Nocardioides ochotonae TaxID=2685869 RepID=UPI0014085A69|nr:hypothetical protein [Nocardioides ochotonae]
MSARTRRTRSGHPGRTHVNAKKASTDNLLDLARGGVELTGRHVVDLGLACLLGLGGAALGVHLVDERGEQTAREPGDRVQGAIAALREDPVYVAPDGRDMVSVEGEQRLERLIAAAPVPVHVLVWEASMQAGPEPYSFTLPDQLATELGEPGIYIVWQGPEDVGVDVPEGKRLGWEVPDLENVGDAETQLSEFITALPASGALEDAESNDYWGGVGGGIAAALLMVAAPTALGAYLLTGFARLATGRPFRNRPRPTSKGTR